MLNWIETRTDEELAAAARALFASAFPDPPEPAGVWAAPGRVNLIGEHTDYNGGYVLPIALPTGTVAVARRRDDDLVRLASEGKRVEVRLGEVSREAGLGWASYAAGVGWAARRDGLDVPGLDIAFAADVPRGAGLSSSASLSCATASAWNDLAGWGLDALFAPTSTVTVALLTALLGGSILLNVFKDELPASGRSSYRWFLAGLSLYAVLLTLVTALGE